MYIQHLYLIKTIVLLIWLNMVKATIKPDAAIAPKLICYYINWARYYAEPMNHNPEDMPVEMCEYIVYYSAKMNPHTYTVESRDLHADETLEGWKKVAALKLKGARILLGVGAYNDNLPAFTNMSQYPENREAFTKSAMAILLKHKFSGLLFDWSYPGDTERNGSAQDKPNFVLLLSELKSVLKAKNLKLAITGPDSEKSIDAGYNVKEISKLVDQIHVKSYDLNGPWHNYVESSSPLFGRDEGENTKMENNIRHLMNIWIIKGAPRYRLYLTISALTSAWMILSDPSKTEPGSAATPTKLKGPFTNLENYMSYNEICGELMTGKWNVSWDSRAHMHYAVNGKVWISYEDPQSVADKANFVRFVGLGGICLMGSSYDDFRGLCGEIYPITKSIRRVLDEP